MIKDGLTQFLTGKLLDGQLIHDHLEVPLCKMHDGEAPLGLLGPRGNQPTLEALEVGLCLIVWVFPVP